MLRTALALAACLVCAHAASSAAPAPAPGPPQIAGLSSVDTSVPSNCSQTVKIGDVATIHYTGTLANGTQFDSSRGRQPFSFEVGKHQVLPGVEYGVIGMCAGEKRNLTMAPELGYGIKGSPPAVPGNATLKFDVEMLNITMPAAPAPNPLAPLAPLVTTFLQQAVNGIINGK